MNFKEFKGKYLKVPVVEYPNNRKDKDPLVTVKLVTYNHVGFIEQCLNSILMQKTNFDFEILIAEDDSNDGTRDICKRYADNYPDKIKLLLNSRENNISINGKPSGTFNSVYANFLISSKYISIIEGDDYWTDDFSLQKRVQFLEKNDDFVLCFHNAYAFWDEDKILKKKLVVPFNLTTEISDKSFLKTGMPTLTLFFRNKLVETFEDDMLHIVSGDAVLRGKLGHYGKAMYLHDIKPAMYRVHNGGVYSSETYSKQAKFSIGAREYLIEYYRKKGWDNTHIVNQTIFYYYVFFRRILSNENKIKIGFVWRIIILAFKYKIPLIMIILKKIKYKITDRYGNE